MVAGKSPDWLPPGFTEKVKYKNGRKIKLPELLKDLKPFFFQRLFVGKEWQGGLGGLAFGKSVGGHPHIAVTYILVTVRISTQLWGLEKGFSLHFSFLGRSFCPFLCWRFRIHNMRIVCILKHSVIQYYYNVATGAKYHSKKEVLSFATADNGLLGTPETTKVDNSGLSSNKEVDTILDKTNESPEWLPSGWTMEEKTRQGGSRKGSVYKYLMQNLAVSDWERSTGLIIRIAQSSLVFIYFFALTVLEQSVLRSVYTDLSSGSRFYSRAAVTRYLNTVDHPNTVTVQNKLDEVDEPSPDMSQQGISMTNTEVIQVAVESSAADDLPPGWIKEIITSKSGNKIRKDPYYTDPVSGYVFRSKLDALRYLKTNDIGSCACRPKKRELDDLKLIKNKVTSPVPASEQLSVQKRQLFPELNGGGENSGANIPSESEAKILKQTQDNSNSNAETDKNPEPANEVPKQDAGVMAVDVAISATVTDPLSEQKILGSGTEKQTDITPVKSRTSKKRNDPSVPLRASKRLAGSEPEVQPTSVLNERSLRAAAKRSSGSEVDTLSSPSVKASASMPLPSDVERAKEEILQKVESLDKVEKPSTEDQAIPDEQTGTQASEKQQDDGKRPQESQLCYDFGDSWSDPLEFALKTLRGEIPIDDTLSFAGCFSEQVGIPYNKADGCLKPSQRDEPIIFQNEFGHHSESSKQQGAVNELPANPSSFSALGNISFPTCNGFNSQSSTGAVKKDSQTTFNP
ncbi:UNVERIFIED_CONTAM: Methyl-CpG-binding domain-containing protein 13 [Sesamum calycinum]|uniref:Methyl-CpG-binding domain-containing protein 13 n=1 Tax=Sesamum calycinum TaxID=2727403 RepID=A0AAW2QZQ5_9LAMI